MPRNKRLVIVVLGALLPVAAPAAAIDLGGNLGGIDVAVSSQDGQADSLDPLDAYGDPVARPLGQSGALQAVRANRALPLEDILVRARLMADGEIIDAQLVQIRSILVYEIKVLTRNGSVSQLYFYARSGAPVRPG